MFHRQQLILREVKQGRAKQIKTNQHVCFVYKISQARARRSFAAEPHGVCRATTDTQQSTKRKIIDQTENNCERKHILKLSSQEITVSWRFAIKNFAAPSTSKTALVSSTNPFTKTVETTKHDLDTLLEEAEIANAKLQSLQQSPPHRPWYGKANFTCKNCHFKGHKVTKPCTLPPRRGFNECGILSMHQAHKVQISQAKSEVKSLERKVKNKQDELESLSLMQGRTRANFFSTMRPRLLNCDPIKYSSRETLENDLRVLASACNHKLPDDNIDLEDIISKKKNECHQLKRSSSSVEVHEVATSPKHRAVDQQRSQDSKRLRNITKRRQQSPPRRYNDKKRDKGYEWRKNLQPSPHYRKDNSPYYSYYDRMGQHSSPLASSTPSNSRYRYSSHEGSTILSPTPSPPSRPARRRVSYTERSINLLDEDVLSSNEKPQMLLSI
ncbi:hypothetical protein QZH41_003910 [Actinostola sp. cb2023]|nr:hypothetical protein QZH41_003910 [Actinostola sp. cb2023]